MKNFIGEYCIIRSDRAGVFAGVVDDTDGDKVLLKNSRRIWSWEGACSCSQIAMDGVGEDSRIAMVVPEMIVSGVIEMIPATETARTNIEGQRVWKC
jgi:hypothetical protein